MKVPLGVVLFALASSLMALAAGLWTLHERRHWSEMSCEDYVALLEGDDGVTWA